MGTESVDLRNLVGSFSVPPVAPETITTDTRLVEDLGISSLQLIRLLVHLEQALGLKVDEGQLIPDNFVTYGSLCKLFGR